MTALLVESIWFPADSRLTRVSPGAVLQLITTRGESSALNVYEDRRIVGNLVIDAIAAPLDRQSKSKLRLNGRINLDRGPFAGMLLTIDHWMELDRDGGLLAFRLNLKTGNPGINLILAQQSPASPPSWQLKRGDQVLLDSDARQPGDDPEALVPLLLGTLGLDFASLRQQAEKEAGTFQWEARQGEFDLNGMPRRGFVLRLGKAGQKGFRLCVENTGEIVQLETPVSYHLLTDSLRLPSP